MIRTPLNPTYAKGILDFLPVGATHPGLAGYLAGMLALQAKEAVGSRWVAPTRGRTDRLGPLLPGRHEVYPLPASLKIEAILWEG